MRPLAYALHTLAALALYLPRRTRPVAYAVAAGLPLSLLTGAWQRADGRALYHLSQLAWLGWLLAVAIAARVPFRAALALAAVGVGALLGWYPRPAAPAYAALQGLAVVLAGAYAVRGLAACYGPRQRAALVLVVGEGSVLVAPYVLAAVTGGTVAGAWDAALPVRCVTWAALAVVGWQAWRGSVWCSRRRVSRWLPWCSRGRT